MSDNNKPTERKSVSAAFPGVVDALFQGMESVLSAKTVVGEPIQIGDTIILPLMDVTFGLGAGTGGNSQKGSLSNKGGLGGKVSPSAVLIIKNGTTKLVNVKNQDTMAKLIDMIPDIMDKLSQKKEPMMADEEAVHIAFPEK